MGVSVCGRVAAAAEVKGKASLAWRVCTILRSPSESAKMCRRRNYLDDSVDNIFVKEHFEI